MGYVIFFYIALSVIEALNNVFIVIVEIAADDVYDAETSRVRTRDVLRIVLLSILWPASLALKVVGTINAAQAIEDRRYQAEAEALRRENKSGGRRRDRRRETVVVDQHGDVVTIDDNGDGE